MKRREFLTTSSLLTASSVIPSKITYSATTQKEYPNIMLVIGDDMTWWDCEPYGSTQVKTPNMTRLAKEGICFDSMFTSTAMCAPTRQQLYTGLYPVRNGAYPNHSRVYDGTKSLVHYFQSLGYRVGLSGKRHFNPPSSYPFEFLTDAKDQNTSENISRISEFVNRDKNQPYFLIVTCSESHKPWNMGNPSQYDIDTLKVPPLYVDCPKTRKEMANYFGEVTYLDEILGKCIDIVDQSGQNDNTITIFTSEQGAQFPSQGKWTCYDSGLKTAFIVRWPDKIKANTRTRAMAQYVDLVPTLLEAVGVDPTTIDTGCPDANGHEGFDGKSFYKVLIGDKGIHRDYVYGAHTTRGIINGSACYPIRSIRSNRYKYIENLYHTEPFYNLENTNEKGLWAHWKELGKTDDKIARLVKRYRYRPAIEMYDIQVDPYELKNMANSQAIWEVQDELKTLLHEWMKQQGDQGIATELQANERQGLRGRKNWKAYKPDTSKYSSD
jgi:N-sulfoglucosamine sulfohydrolase